MTKAKKLLFTFALAAVIMVTAVETLGSAQPVEAAPELSYQTYKIFPMVPFSSADHFPGHSEL